MAGQKVVQTKYTKSYEITKRIFMLSYYIFNYARLTIFRIFKFSSGTVGFITDNELLAQLIEPNEKHVENVVRASTSERSLFGYRIRILLDGRDPGTNKFANRTDDKSSVTWPRIFSSTNQYRINYTWAQFLTQISFDLYTSIRWCLPK